MKSYDVSIIVPVYNVEKYIEKCATTLFEQDYENIEYIFVNDKTPDNSVEVLQSVIEKFPNRKNDIKIINNEQNQGPNLSRKNGLDASNGEWILFVDSDDCVELDMVSYLIENTKKNQADIIVFDIYEVLKNKTKLATLKLKNDKFNILNSFAIKPGYMNYICNKLIKKELFNKFVWSNNNLTICEDLLLMFKLFFYAQNIYQINKPLYYYNRQNENSIMNNYKIKYFYDKVYVTNEIIKFLQENNSEKEYLNLINFYKLYTKLVLILYPNIRDSELWTKTYPEANKFVWQTNLKFRHKILTYLASKNLFKLAYFLQDLKKYIK